MFIPELKNFMPFWVTDDVKTLINPFPTSCSPLYPTKTSENWRFSDVFRGNRNGALVENGLILR